MGARAGTGSGRKRRGMQSATMDSPLRVGYHEVEVVGGGEWMVPEKYRELRPLGIGTFGTVW